jgi:hypothetical protein
LSKATRQVSRGETFRLGSQTVKALTSVDSGQDILVFKNSSDGLHYCIAGRKEESRVINERVILSRHTHPVKKRRGIPDLCKILRLAFVYRIINEDSSQSFYLVDFSGEARLLITIPAAIRYFHDDTWTFEYSLEFDYSTYEIYQFPNNSDNGLRSPGEGEDISGSETLVVTGTRTYGPDYDEPRALTMKTKTASLTQVWATAIFYYSSFGPGAPIAGPSGTRPSYTTFDKVLLDDEGEEDPGRGGWYPWDYVYPNPSTPIYYAAYADDPDAEDIDLDAFEGVGWPWGNYNTAYTGDDQANPEVTPGRIASARYLISLTEPPTITIPPGQSKREPEPTSAETQTRISYANGKLVVLIRSTGRPPGDLPDDWDGDTGVGYYEDIHIFKVEDGEITTGGESDLPDHIKPFNDSRPSSVILEELQEEASTTKDYLERYMAITGLGNFDYLPARNEFYPVDSGVETVFGWQFEFLSASLLEDLLLEEDSSVRIYRVRPVHFTQGEVLTSNEIPLKETIPNIPGLYEGNISTKRSIRVNPLKDREDIDPETFSVLAITASFNLNDTIYVCSETKDIETPIPDPGSG